MKVLLVSPPFYRLTGFYTRYFPYGLGLIATSLRDAGHDAVVYDADLNVSPANLDFAQLPNYYPKYLDSFRDADNPVWREVERNVLAFSPDLIGIQVYTSFAASAFYLARIVKKVLPRCRVVMGGPHIKVRAEEVMRICPDVDFSVTGEGEITMPALAAELASAAPDFSRVPGLFYRADEKMRQTAGKPSTTPLDDIPFPDRTLLMQEKSYSSEDMGMIMASRGCPFSCTFCATDTKTFRRRSSENILREILEVKERYGTTQFTFKDDSFALDPKTVADFCDLLLRSKIRINWECNARVNFVEKGILSKMRAAGCNFIKVGVESGSQRILERMNKGLNLAQIRAAAKLLRESGIHWTGYFMMGVPGETKDDILLTLRFMKELSPDLAAIGVYEPFPGTAMFEDGMSRSLVKRNMSYEEFFSTAPNNYYKVDPNRQTDTMTSEEFSDMEALVKEAFHSHNKSFSRVVLMGVSRWKIYLAEPAALWSDFKKYLKY